MSYPKKGLSIDIGNDKIKIIEYKRNKDKAKILKSLLIDTPDNCLEDGVVTHIDTLAEVIREELKSNRIKEKKVIFTVASSKIITREVDLPDLPKKKLDALIQMNAEEYFPVDLSGYTTDYRILDHYVDGEDKMIRVNMVAAFTELMESYINLGGVLGLKIHGVDFAGNSIVNYATHLKQSGTYLLLDLGSNSTMVTIMSDNTVRFNRNLVFGTSLVINSIQNHFNVRYKEAVKISGEQSLLKEDAAADDDLTNEVTGSLNQVLSGVSRLLDFYTSRNKEGIEKIYIVGGGTKIKGIVDYITGYFDVESEVIDTVESFTSADVVYNENAVFYANGMGAIFSEMNLLPKTFLNKDKDKAANRLRLELSILALFLFVGAMYIPYMNVKALREEKVSLQNEIDEKRVIEPIIAEYNTITQRLNYYKSVDQLTGSSTEIIVQILEIMEKEIPSTIDYLALNNTEEGMTISCTADEKLTIINFVTALKNMELYGHPVFSDVYLPTISESEVDAEQASFSFAITCKYYEGVE